MTEAQAVSPVMRGNQTTKFTAFLLGAVTYFTFLFTILYAIGFVSGFAVPRTIDTDVKSGHSRQLSPCPWRKFT
jgi:methanethiol S-methyltransferase